MAGSEQAKQQRAQCLATFLREAPPGSLTRADVRALKKDREWVTENPAQAKKLNALIGKEVIATRDLHSIDSVLRFRIGRRYRVLARWQERLIVYDLLDENLILSISPDWVGRAVP